MNHLQAMRDRNIRCHLVDDDDGLMYFPNGVVLPIIAYWSADRSHQIERLTDGAWIEFGDDDFGYGWYPVRMITEEEWYEQQGKH
jgi:hypothetical protein